MTEKAGTVVGLTLQTPALARDGQGGGKTDSGGWKAPGAGVGEGRERGIKADQALAQVPGWVDGGPGTSRSEGGGGHRP